MKVLLNNQTSFCRAIPTRRKEEFKEDIRNTKTELGTNEDYPILIPLKKAYDNYDTNNLIFEMDGFAHQFKGWEQQKLKPIPNVKNIVNVLTTQWERASSENDVGWGSSDFIVVMTDFHKMK